jgi:hypothetical protein
MVTVALLFLATVLVAFSFQARKEHHHGTLQLLKIFLPSWRFFEGAGHQARIFWQVAPSGDWKPLPRVTQPFGSLLINARFNEQHAFDSQVECLLNEIADVSRSSDAKEVERSVSFRLVADLIERRIPDLAWERFKIEDRNGVQVVLVNRKPTLAQP